MESRESLMDNRNDCLTESSIAKPLLGYSSDNPIGTCYIEERGTKREKPMLVDSNGYSYNINGRSKTARTTYWQCTHRPNNKTKRCKASVLQSGNKFQFGRHSHNHKPKETKTQTKKLKSAKAIVTEEPDSGLETQDYPTGNDCLTESSIDEPLLGYGDSANGIGTCRIKERGTKRRRPMLVDSHGYTYNINGQGKTTIYWQCTHRPNIKNERCKASVLQSGNKFQFGRHSHNHKPKETKTQTKKLKSAKAIVTEEPDSGVETRNFPSAQDLGTNIERWLKENECVVFINPTWSPLQGGVSCLFTFYPDLPSGAKVKASFGNIALIMLEKTGRDYQCIVPAIPDMKPDDITVKLVSMNPESIIAQTTLNYREKLFVQEEPGAHGSGRREDGSNDGGASGGRVSGGGSSGGGSSGGRSSGEGASGSGASGDGTGGTGEGGCGGKGCGTYGNGAIGCQYRRDASQPGSDVESELCECLKKCSVGIWRQKPSAPQNKACTESEEDLEDGQLSCTQESKENYFSDTEDCSSSETDSAFSDSESWDESLSDSSLSFRWVNSGKSQRTIPETESTQLLASHDDTPVHCLDAPDLNVENAESQYQDNELFETLHAENAKPQNSKSVLSGTSNQQSATCVGSTTQSQAAQSLVNSPLWNGDRKLNVAPPQDSDEEIHSGQEWEESVANTCIMENEANGLTDSFVARHTTDPTLRLGLLFRNQNGSRHDQGTGMGAETAGPNNTATDSSAAGSPSAEVFLTNSQASNLFALSPLNIRPWNVESLESTSNSHLALSNGPIAQENGEREQRELEREQLQTNQDRREREIRMRRNREMIGRERREMRRSGEWREWQEAGE